MMSTPLSVALNIERLICEARARQAGIDVAAIAGFGAAAVHAIKGLDEAVERMESLRDQLLDGLRGTIGEGLSR